MKLRTVSAGILQKMKSSGGAWRRGKGAPVRKAHPFRLPSQPNPHSTETIISMLSNVYKPLTYLWAEVIACGLDRSRP